MWIGLGPAQNPLTMEAFCYLWGTGYLRPESRLAAVGLQSVLAGAVTVLDGRIL